MKATLQYVQGTSFFHQLNPLTKLIWALLAGVLCFVCQNLYFLLAINVINIAIILNSKIGRAGKGVYKLFAVISVLLLFFTVFFNREGHMLVDHALGFITITDEGVRARRSHGTAYLRRNAAAQYDDYADAGLCACGGACGKAACAV